MLLSVAIRQAPAPTPKPELLAAAQVPAALKLPGKLLEAWRWRDANGENLLLISRTATRPEPKTKYMDEERYTELYARQYVSQGGAVYRELWRLYDANRYCWGDMELGPLPGATAITDLDHDGYTETMLLYKLSCRTDTSPANMKLVMHEGTAKYALRGQMTQLANHASPAERARAKARKLCCGDQVNPKADDAYLQYEGLYQNEKDFADAPPAFLAFAREQWRKWRTKDSFEPLP